MAAGINLKEPRIRRLIPNVGDTIVKSRGEFKGNFIVIERFSNFVLAAEERTKIKESFTNISIILNELQIVRVSPNFKLKEKIEYETEVFQ